MGNVTRILPVLHWLEVVIAFVSSFSLSNAVASERTKLPDLPSLIADRRHSLFSHICHLPENTPASQALQLSIEAHTGTPPAADWKRPPGHPRRTWLQQVEEDIGLSVGAVQIASQDCSKTRSLTMTLSWSSTAVNEWVSEGLLTINFFKTNFNRFCLCF